MNKRITLITLFEEETINTINNLVKILDQKICKVPYGIDDNNREKMDTLPFHITISAWDKAYEEQVVMLLNDIDFEKIKIEVKQVEIMNGKNNSFVLVLSIKENNDMKHIQEIIYNKIPSQKYKPDRMKFHITLHIDKDYGAIIQMKEKLENKFRPFEIEISEFGLFEIYPANLIKKVSNFNNRNDT